MKKLLVLVLVLGLASLASAQMTWTGAYDPVTKIVNVSVTDNEGQMYIALAITDGDGTLSPFARGADSPLATASAFTMGADGDKDFQGYGEGEIWSILDVTTGTPVYNDGEWVKATYVAGTTATSTATMYEFTEAGGVGNSRGTIFIPEPATIALLCLGGLLLRRKK